MQLVPFDTFSDHISTVKLSIDYVHGPDLQKQLDKLIFMYKGGVLQRNDKRTVDSLGICPNAHIIAFEQSNWENILTNLPGSG